MPQSLSCLYYFSGQFSWKAVFSVRELLSVPSHVAHLHRIQLSKVCFCPDSILSSCLSHLGQIDSRHMVNKPTQGSLSSPLLNLRLTPPSLLTIFFSTQGARISLIHICISAVLLSNTAVVPLLLCSLKYPSSKSGCAACPTAELLPVERRKSLLYCCRIFFVFLFNAKILIVRRYRR